MTDFEIALITLKAFLHDKLPATHVDQGQMLTEDLERHHDKMVSETARLEKNIREAKADRDLAAREATRIKIEPDFGTMAIHYQGCMTYRMLDQAYDPEGLLEAAGQKMAMDMIQEFRQKHPRLRIATEENRPL